MDVGRGSFATCHSSGSGVGKWSELEGKITVLGIGSCLLEFAVVADPSGPGSALHGDLFLEQSGVVFVVLVREEFFNIAVEQSFRMRDGTNTGNVAITGAFVSPQIRGLILGLAAALIGFPLISWAYFLTHMVPSGHADFRANYTAGYMLRMSKPLYDYSAEVQAQNKVVSREGNALPFIHPAYEALLYLPLSFLSYVTAFWTWFGVNIGLLILAYRLMRAELGSLAPVASCLPAATLLAYLPIGTCLVQGQDSVLLLTLLAASSSLLRNQRLLLAGVCLGLGVFRFQIVIPIVVCFALWRQWRLIVGFLAAAVPAALLSIQIAGFSSYLKTIQGLSRQVGELQQSTAKMPNLRGLIESLGGDAWLVLVFSLIVVASVGLMGKKFSLHRQLSIAIATGSLVSYHCLLHDLSVLLIPCSLLFIQRTGRSFAIAGLVFFAPTLMIFSPNHFYFAVIGSLALLGSFFF